MSDTVTDPLEKAVLSGAIFAGKNPDGEEPHRTPSNSDIEDNDIDTEQADGGFAAPTAATNGGGSSSAPVTTTKGQSHNTGVKGVLSDYRNRNNHPSNGNDKSNAAGSKGFRKGFKGLSLTSNSQKHSNFTDTSHELSQSSDDDGDDDGLSEGERDAREAYRRKRIQEMQKTGSGERDAVSSNGRLHQHQQKFGHLREVGQDQFVKATEDRNAQCVLVHIYSPSIPSCTALNHHLSSLARRYPHTKFLRAHSRALEFAAGDEEDVLPTIIVYRQGEVYKNLVAFDRELLVKDDADDDDEDEVDSRKITRDLVERALISHDILQAHSAVHVGSSGEEDDSE